MTVRSGSNRFNSRRGQVLLENLTAYLFLSPAMLIIFIFGLFPVGFAFFVSLHEWGRFPDEYAGLEQYIEALGNFGYVLFFWLAIGAAALGAAFLWRMWQDTRASKRGLLMLIPGIANATAVLAFTNWFFLLLLFVMNVPVRLRGQESTSTAFVNEFFASFRFPEVLAAANSMWIFVLAALILTIIFAALRRTGQYLTQATLIFLSFASAYLLMRLTLTEIQKAVDAAREAGETLPIWSQIIFISAGAGMLFLAYGIWQRAVRDDSDRKFILQALAAILLVVGGYLLIAEFPRALAAADIDILRGFNITVMYTLGTVPFQLALGLGLAVLLFQNIKGKAFFRVVYFMPYITPFVATSSVFALLFSHRPDSPINQLINLFGVPDQTWLLQPKGIFELLFGENVPSALVGPGLALIVIMIYTTWVYSGYSTVIFLAGLGNIPKEMYEAAKIDGANGWQSFRYITLPLLSPTTFFLVLIATIGTFQAFTQLYLLGRAGTYEAVNTINIYIFDEIRANRPDYAYGSAMAFVLFGVILILTLLQNRYAQRRVFYG